MRRGRSPLERVVEALRHAGAYRHPVERVTVIQTHVSVVFLAGDFVYKLKKPVRFAFVDMSRLAERLHFCEEEVRLNRRLSPDLYLGVVPITESPAGIRVGGEGAPLDYAVHMRRLPEERMMDRLLGWRALGRPMVERLAEHIAEFHARAATGPDISKYGSPEAVGPRTHDVDAGRGSAEVLSAWRGPRRDWRCRSLLRRGERLVSELLPAHARLVQCPAVAPVAGESPGPARRRGGWPSQRIQ